jgi:putative FmdB family regulatory protein
MPLYEYKCEECEARFEQLRPLSAIDDPASCPAGHSGRRVISIFSAVCKDSAGEPNLIGGGCSGGCANCACGSN